MRLAGWKHETRNWMEERNRKVDYAHEMKIEENPKISSYRDHIHFCSLHQTLLESNLQINYLLLLLLELLSIIIEKLLSVIIIIRLLVSINYYY